MIYLNLADDGRVLSAQSMPETKIAVESLPNGNLYDYKYIKGEFVFDPLPKPDEPTKPTTVDVIEAQVMYTALMTDTLLVDEV